MSNENGSKINQLIRKWPSGTVATLVWMKSLGISQQLAYRYRMSGWIEGVGQGAYVKSGDNVLWDGALYALQFQLESPVHVAGITALSLLGRAQYLSAFNNPVVNLVAERGSTIPCWFKDGDWQARVNINFKRPIINRDKFFNKIQVNGNFKVDISCSELAILEYIDRVNSEELFLSAKELMEGMLDLRLDLLQELLENWRSIKVKRIFLYLADNLNLPCFEKLNLSKISIGTGKRSIFAGGVLNKKYSITVPYVLEHNEEILF